MESFRDDAIEVVVSTQLSCRVLDGLVSRNEVDDLGVRLLVGDVREAVVQHFVQDHPKRIDIARGRDLFAADLLGRGVLRRHHAELRSGSITRVFRFEHLCDTEVEEFGSACIVNKYVRRF